jgi:hypothetical protein
MKIVLKAVVCPPSQEVKRGRPPLFGKAMTGAELSARSRAKKREAQPSSSNRILPDLKSARLVDGPLTKQIQSPDSFVRLFIDEHFRGLSALSAACNRDLKQHGFTKVKSENAPWMQQLVGTAIDYRIGAYFDRNIHESGAVKGGLDRLTARKKVGATENLWYRGRPERRAVNFIKSFEEFVEKIKPERRRLRRNIEEKLCRYCVAFAYLDFIYRSDIHFPLRDRMISWGHLEFDEMLNRLETEIVTDVLLLSEKFYANNRTTLQLFKKAVLGRSLTGSRDVGKADFDIVVDGCLFEFKSTPMPKIKTEYLRQLIGYWLLDYNDSLRIRFVAVALVRHGHMQKYSIPLDLLSSRTPMSAIRRDFRKGLRRVNSM